MGFAMADKICKWEYEARPLPADPGTEPDSPVYQGEGFDPYAGNLDQLLGY
jgi:hypothetical protein